MSVYLKDSKVLLDNSGNIATSSDCCCSTGVCCYCNGTCDPDTTQDDCEGGGGQWWEGYTCDDDICPSTNTGACCVGHDCSIQTESCCGVSGGHYRGDDTICEACTCGCGFFGFLFMGRYNTAQSHTEGSYSNTSLSETENFTADSTTEIDSDTCEVTCLSFSGSGESSRSDGIGFDCTGSFEATSCLAETCLCSGNCTFSGILVSTGPYGTGSYMGWTVDDSFCDFLCTNNSDFWNLILTATAFSDSVLQNVWHFDDGTTVIDITQTVTLSDQCASTV